MGETMSQDGTFSAEELAAMKQRAAELREEAKPAKGAAKREREAAACADAIATLTGTDHEIAARLHEIVTSQAPHLDPKTWYGFPSYAREGKVVIFFQPQSKFDTRYATIGFNEDALLDDGDFWPTAFAVRQIDAPIEARLRELVRRAAG